MQEITCDLLRIKSIESLDSFLQLLPQLSAEPEMRVLQARLAALRCNRAHARKQCCPLDTRHKGSAGVCFDV